MKAICLVLFSGVAIAAAAYFGLWLCLVGGIIQVIESAKLSPIDSYGIAIGIVRVLCTGAVAYVSAALVGAIGVFVSALFD